MRQLQMRQWDELEINRLCCHQGPLTILPMGVRYREEKAGTGPGFKKGDLVKIR
jgi:FKBP-type peptidyl-prolyl cis-trans isomerase